MLKNVKKTKNIVSTKQIAAGEFKAKCLSLIDQVNETGQELIITKRASPRQS